MKPSRGFTLIELLVALALLALAATLSWRGLDAVVRHRDALNAREQTTASMQRLFAQLQADFDHLIDGRSLGAGASFEAVSQRDGVLTLLRKPRNGATEIEMVRYAVSSNKLYRISYRVSDSLAALAAMNDNALGVKDAKLIFEPAVRLETEAWREAGETGRRWALLAPPQAPAAPAVVQIPGVGPVAAAPLVTPRMLGARVRLALSEIPGETRSFDKVFLLERAP